MKNVTVILLAAGKSTRMKSKLPKIFHKIGGFPLFSHIIKTLDDADIKNRIAVINQDNKELFSPYQHIQFAIQHEQKGTAHAVQTAEKLYKNISDSDIVLVLFADTPFVKESTIKKLINALEKTPQKAIEVVGFECFDSNSYGRIFTNSDGNIERIIEFKDCNQNQKKQTMCNSGIMAFRAGFLKNNLDKIESKNVKNEYYLTDMVELAVQSGFEVGLTLCDEASLCGVNSPKDLAFAEQLFQKQKREVMLENGVQMIDPSTVYFSLDTHIESDTLIEPFVFFGPQVKIGSESRIKSFSHLENCCLDDHVEVGPYARIRPGTVIESHAKVGNFVEVKNSHLKSGVKASHLSYIGDSDIGNNSNIGAGTITCNYDGHNKYKTFIGEGSFIGSNSSLIAPVEIGDNTIIAAGSVITRNVSDHTLSIARSKQVNKENWTKRMAERKQKSRRHS